MDLVDVNVFKQYVENLTPPEMNNLTTRLLDAVMKEVAAGNYENLRKINAQDNNSFKMIFDFPDGEFWANKPDSFYRHLATALIGTDVIVEFRSNFMDRAINFVHYLQSSKVKVKFFGELSQDGAADFARKLQDTNVTQVFMGWGAIDDNGLFQFVKNLQNTKVNSLRLFSPISPEGFHQIIDLIPLTNLTAITQKTMGGRIIAYPEQLNEALAENKRRILRANRTAALAAAMIAHDHDNAPSDKVDYPHGQEQTEKGTEYARGIIGQLQNCQDGTLNHIMHNILSFLPDMDNKRATQAMELAVSRRKLEEKRSTKEEGFEHQEDNPLKRINPSHNHQSKRSRISPREISSLNINANDEDNIARLRRRKIS